MSPSVAMPYGAYQGYADAKSLGERLAGLLRCKYLKHIAVAEFPVILFASRLSALCDLVLHVVGRSTKKEVVRIDARRNVAAMANEHLVRYGSVKQLPTDPVCVRPVLATVDDDAIPVGEYASDPNPTAGLGDALNALLEILSNICSHGTSTKVVGRYPYRGTAGPLSLFPAVSV